MSEYRFRVEFMPIPYDGPREAMTAVFDWDGDAAMKDARIWYFGGDPYVRVLWCEPVTDPAGAA